MKEAVKVFYAGFAVILAVVVGLVVAGMYAPTRGEENAFQLGAVLFAWVATPLWEFVVSRHYDEPLLTLG